MGIYVGVNGALEPTTPNLLPADIFESLTVPEEEAHGFWRVRLQDKHTPFKGLLLTCICKAVQGLSTHPADSAEVWSAEYTAGCVIIRREHDRGVEEMIIAPYGKSF